jgi:hypothetical protein
MTFPTRDYLALRQNCIAQEASSYGRERM